MNGWKRISAHIVPTHERASPRLDTEGQPPSRKKDVALNPDCVLSRFMRTVRGVLTRHPGFVPCCAWSISVGRDSIEAPLKRQNIYPLPSSLPVDLVTSVLLPHVWNHADFLEQVAARRMWTASLELSRNREEELRQGKAAGTIQRAFKVCKQGGGESGVVGGSSRQRGEGNQNKSNSRGGAGFLCITLRALSLCITESGSGAYGRGCSRVGVGVGVAGRAIML